MVDLLVRRDGKGGRLLAVEGTEAEEVGSAPLSQPHIAGDDVDNVVSRDELVYKSVRKGRFDHLLGVKQTFPAYGEAFFILTLKAFLCWNTGNPVIQKPDT